MKIGINRIQLGLLLVMLLTLPDMMRAQFTFITNADNTLTVMGYSGDGGAVVIPSEVSGRPVSSIGELAFQGCSNLMVLRSSMALNLLEKKHSAIALS